MSQHLARQGVSTRGHSYRAVGAGILQTLEHVEIYEAGRLRALAGVQSLEYPWRVGTCFDMKDRWL